MGVKQCGCGDVVGRCSCRLREIEHHFDVLKDGYKSLELELASTKKMLNEALKTIRFIYDCGNQEHQWKVAEDFLAKHERREGV